MGIRKGEKAYDECIKHREFWDNLQNTRLVDVEEIVLPFLNKWKCRLLYACASELTSTLQKTEQLVQPLRRLQIEDLDAISAIQGNSIADKPFCLIEEVFENISAVKSGRRSVAFTAASKILHMTIPTFFVMSDERIRKHYGFEGNSSGYVNFMLTMNLLARDLITQIGDKQRILAFSHFRERTLARLLDNYNYTLFTLGCKP
jgi:hypothetical protein